MSTLAAVFGYIHGCCGSLIAPCVYIVLVDDDDDDVMMIVLGTMLIPTDSERRPRGTGSDEWTCALTTCAHKDSPSDAAIDL